MSVKQNKDKSAYELMHDKLPPFATQLRSFGGMAVIRDIKNQKKSKLKN